MNDSDMDLIVMLTVVCMIVVSVFYSYTPII